MNIAATKTNVAYDRARRDIVTGVIAANEAIDEVVLGSVTAWAGHRSGRHSSSCATIS